MKNYSLLNLIKQSFSHHEHWPKVWRNPKPKHRYKVVIVGAGGHGLATAYYLAKEHGISDVVVLDKSYLGGGSVGRNTTIVRSNYLLDETSFLYEHSMKLWERLSQELNFNLMFSQRGVLNLVHNVQEMRDTARRVNSNKMNGIDAELLNTAQVKKLVPILNTSTDVRYPVLGASYQSRGGTARHDAVAWGFARAANDLGVDIVQNCEVKGIRIDNGQIRGVDTTKGFIETSKLGLAVAGNTTILGDMAGLRLPIETHPLQALVSEPIKPIMDCVVMSNAVHAYVSQTDKGELIIGAGIDQYTGYGLRGSYSVVESTIESVVEMFPIFSRLRLLRHWAGAVDISPDASPILGKTHIKGLYLNCGWGTGGFKSTPGSGWVYASTIANDQPHRLNEPFSLERFSTGELIDEHGAAAVAH